MTRLRSSRTASAERTSPGPATPRRGLYFRSVLPALELRQLPVLFVDCQATTAAPRGQLLELAWATASDGPLEVAARLVRLPAGERVPPQVERITGITTAAAASGVSAADAFASLKQAAAALGEPAPAVAHFARFERPFLDAHGGSAAVELVCTHEVARRLLPELPRRSLRALSGYFGRAVPALRRAAAHVEATAYVWRAMLPLLEARGVCTWAALRAWLCRPPERRARSRYGWPMPRELRLSTPDAPGLYRMLRSSGDVLYVGKATSLKKRVNSYFRKHRGVHERTLEMLSQARGLSYVVAESPLEAALLEPDEIKRHRPPYNVAHVDTGRDVWFVSSDWSERSLRASPRCPIGPFPSLELVEQVAALAAASPTTLGRYGPSPGLFAEGHAGFLAAHPELRQPGRSGLERLLAVAGRLWREGRRAGDDDDEPLDEAAVERWTVATTQRALEWLALRAGLALRRARWLTRLSEATLAWSERSAGPRRLVLERGVVSARESGPLDGLPVPLGHRLSRAARHEGFDVARLDRLRALTTELKRLVEEGAQVRLRLNDGPPLDEVSLARILGWL